VKNAIDIVLNRLGDGVGAVVLGLATRGFGGLPRMARMLVEAVLGTSMKMHLS